MRVRYFQNVLMWILFAGIGILPMIAGAQPADFGNPDFFTDPDLPIDGGVGLLIAAGVGYGIKKIRDERKKKQATQA